MALITFTSDFGDSDYYVPAVKAKMLSINQDLKIIDITHKVENYDVAHAAFTLKSVYPEFPKGTVHLLAMNSTSSATDGYIGIYLKEHIFLGPNNGVLSLLSEYDPDQIVKFNYTKNIQSSFPVKDILAPIAAKLALGNELKQLGEPVTQMKKMIPRNFKATKKQILGHVIRVDNYGNLITNITKEVFDTLNPGKYNIEFGRESLTKLYTNYDQVESGDCFAFFNSLGLLEIGINYGHGSDLLGLKLDSPVFINFETEN
ncbi:SAM hydrolase/SAM-dependent halogenase family protein [Shivajiella indica]|uniref:S-adenosyl-l-methionine hydroxide adenosyltransferase family protein n=1 Tax=Shivajiella indica TaxID=872115 RepID=A0ABW5B802_9BACT